MSFEIVFKYFSVVIIYPSDTMTRVTLLLDPYQQYRDVSTMLDVYQS